jgi:uncharacterized protein (DUF305 family)
MMTRRRGGDKSEGKRFGDRTEEQSRAIQVLWLRLGTRSAIPRPEHSGARGRPGTHAGPEKDGLTRSLFAPFLALLVASAASLAAGPPGEAGEPSQSGAAAAALHGAGTAARDGDTATACADPDLRFMLDMLVHHEQALTMTALVADRTERDDIRRLARRIEVSQLDEIEQMRRWLEGREECERESAHRHDHADHHGGSTDHPREHHHGREHRHRHDHGDGHDHGHHGTGAMPGMLSEAQLARLAAASGAEFDRIFLEYMIYHHEGALIMVDELFAADGAAQDTEIFAFASHVAADQRIEIERMRRMLEAGF